MRIFVLLLVAFSAACAHTSYSDTAESALGRVVVYRNGIAYYERRAEVTDNHLTLRVPQDKVDDFLRSLTVVDEASGEALPVSFPTQSAATDGMVDMVIQLPESAEPLHHLRLSYITESPAWKPSYRLVVQDDGTVQVQGWAIVDNASGEDWNDVRLAVGSSSALSFRFDLRSLREVHRETLQLDESFARPPPTGRASVREQRAQPAASIMRFTDEQLPGELGADGLEDLSEMESVSPDSSGGGGGGGAGVRAMRQPRRPAAQAPAPAVTGLAAELQQSGRNVVIRGYGSSDDRDVSRGSLERANRLRNHLIEQGVAPAQLRVEAAGPEDAQGVGRVEIVGDGQAASSEAEQGAPGEQGIGESHFESEATMTVAHDTSAMVSVLRENADGQIVYFYDPDSERGDARYAYRSVRFQNPTNFTLEAGPATVYGANRFIGEGLTESIPPGAHAFIPFALDRQVRIEREQEQRDEISRILAVDRAAVTAEFRHVRATTLKVRNRLSEAATIYLRHSVSPGWNLRNAPATAERVGDDYIFHITLDPGQTREITLEQDTPMQRTIDLRSAQTRLLLRAFLSRDDVDSQMEEPLRALLDLHRQIDARHEEIASRQRQMRDLRRRSNELHAQILTLEVVRRRDNPLLRHLRSRMEEVSNRIQTSTMELVDLEQERLMLRIRFQDGLAELSLEAQQEAAEPA